jgi:hypothetical protein
MKQKISVLAIILLLIFFLAWRVFGNKHQTSTPTTAPTPETEPAEELDPFATPEHLKNPENHSLSLEIIGPEGDKIFPAQARMYDAHIKGNAKYASAKINCHWKFYLNENNDEVLYQQMDNTSVLGEAQKNVCGFTSTFMNKPGQLRIELTAKLSTFGGELLEEVVAERSYLVAK